MDSSTQPANNAGGTGGLHDSPLEGDGFELPVPPGIGGSPSWWSRTRKPHGAPELGFIDGGTNSSNPPPSSGESANSQFLDAGHSLPMVADEKAH
jgi:hypothetical protein